MTEEFKKFVFSSLDTRSVVTNLKKVCTGMRLNNIYDITPKTFILKLGKASGKCKLLIEAGSRIHATNYQRDHSPLPSSFCAKLRKHLKNRILTSIDQLGRDRVVLLNFGSKHGTANTLHLIVELYSRGNIVLCDGYYSILVSLRRVDLGSTVITAKHSYPIQEFLDSPTSKPLEKLDVTSIAKGETIKKTIVNKYNFGNQLIDHVLIEAGFDLKDKTVEADINTLNEAILRIEQIFQENTNENPKGYLIIAPETEHPLDFLSYHYLQYANSPQKECETFSEAVDEYFFKVETSKAISVKQGTEQAVQKRGQNRRKNVEDRIESYETEAIEATATAKVIEINYTLVDSLISEIKGAMESGLSWKDISNQIEDNKEMDPESSAHHISRILFESHQAILLLFDKYNEFQRDSNQELVPITVDIHCSAFQNVRIYYDLSRKLELNAEKSRLYTEQAVLHSKEKKQKMLEKKQQQAKRKQMALHQPSPSRTKFWFEKFLWFISSDKYLVVAGRDDLQNEQLYRRYLEASDLYFHADIRGASSVVLKNFNKCQPLPSDSLNQAGSFSVINSAAWKERVITSAWYVHPEQVSKQAPSGEYLTTGSFMVRGKKEFVKPTRLNCGFGILFILEKNEREAECNSPPPEFSLKDTEHEQTYQEQKEKELEQVEKQYHETKQEKTMNGKIQHYQSKKQQKHNQNQPERLKRGKKGKLKKMNKKYRNQDPEDQELRVKLLESQKTGKENKIENDNVNDDNKDHPENSPPQDVLQLFGGMNCFKCGEINHLAENCPKIISQIDQMNANDSDVLLQFCGNPSPEDRIVGALPMCGPLEAFKDFKYSVKLIPGGNVKKSHSIKNTIDMFLKKDGATTQERECIQSIPMDIFTLCFKSEAKLSHDNQIKPKTTIKTKPRGKKRNNG